jgi:hypothetical protein
MRKRLVRMALFVLGGGLVGLLYQRLVGCGTGTCILTSSPYVSTAYGGLIGLFASGGLSRSRRMNRAAEPPAEAGKKGAT